MQFFFSLIAAALLMSATLVHPGVALGARVVENLFGAKLVDENLGWVTGAFGVIYKTTDGGLTWEAQQTPIQEDLFSIDFSTKTHGVAVGKKGVVLTTDDGGQTWVQRPSGTERNLASVKFATPDHVWAVGDWGAVIESTDGGATWKDRSLPDDIVLTAQAWSDGQHGVLVGEFGTVQMTSDGGQTWRKAELPTDKTLFGVGFKNPQEGWIVGIDGVIIRTKDGGQTWDLQRGKWQTETLNELGLLEALRNPALYDISISGDHGYIVGDIGMVLVSEDGGETWKEHKLPEEMSLFWIRGVSAAPGGKAVFAGAKGLTAKITGDQIRLAGAKESSL